MQIQVELASQDPADPLSITLKVAPYVGANEPELKTTDGWDLVYVTPEAFKKWIANYEINCDYDFKPLKGRLERLSRIFQDKPSTSGVEVSWVKMLHGNSFEFQDGRHRAWWIALRNPKTIPLLVPKSQRADFEKFFQTC